MILVMVTGYNGRVSVNVVAKGQRLLIPGNGAF